MQQSHGLFTIAKLLVFFAIDFDISSPWPLDPRHWPWPWHLKALALVLVLWPLSLALTLGLKSLLTSLRPGTSGRYEQHAPYWSCECEDWRQWLVNVVKYTVKLLLSSITTAGRQWWICRKPTDQYSTLMMLYLTKDSVLPPSSRPSVFYLSLLHIISYHTHHL